MAEAAVDFWKIAEEAGLIQPESQTPALPERWSPLEEEEFKGWYEGWAQETGINPDPDDPLHFYDYRGAYRAQVYPTPGSTGEWHWPSTFKLPGHPNLIVGGVDTRTGLPVVEKDFWTVADEVVATQPPTAKEDFWSVANQVHADLVQDLTRQTPALWTIIGDSLVGGAYNTAEMYARVGRVLGLDTTAVIKSLKEREPDKELPTEGFMGALSEGIRSTVQSLAGGVPGLAIGAIGGVPGMIGGFALSAGTLFSLAEYDQFMGELKWIEK